MGGEGARLSGGFARKLARAGKRTRSLGVFGIERKDVSVATGRDRPEVYVCASLATSAGDLQANDHLSFLHFVYPWHTRVIDSAHIVHVYRNTRVFLRFKHQKIKFCSWFSNPSSSNAIHRAAPCRPTHSSLSAPRTGLWSRSTSVRLALRQDPVVDLSRDHYVAISSALACLAA